MATSKFVIGPEHLNTINAAIEQSNAALNEIALAKRAGFNMDAQEKAIQDGLVKLRQIKSVYFPNAS